VHLSLQYDRVERKDGYLYIVSNKKIGLANLKGRLLVEPRFDFLQVLANNQLIVGINNRFGVISSDGLSIIPVTYSSMEYDNSKNLYLSHLTSEWTTLKLPINE
jgi:hypothetical protein